jgi:hypothetical protein
MMRSMHSYKTCRQCWHGLVITALAVEKMTVDGPMLVDELKCTDCGTSYFGPADLEIKAKVEKKMSEAAKKATAEAAAKIDLVVARHRKITLPEDQ